MHTFENTLKPLILKDFNKKRGPDVNVGTLLLKFFEYFIDCVEIGVVIFLERDVQILVKTMMEIRVAICTQQTTTVELGFESVANEIFMV